MIRPWLMPTFWFACCLAGAGGLEAEPQILHDTGQAVSIEPYLAPIKPKFRPAGDLPPPPALTVGGYGLPVTTPSMKPGKVQPRSVAALQGKMAGARPLFLIGADQWSLQWLQQNQARLAELHAVGMVVDVDAESDLNDLAPDGWPNSAHSSVRRCHRQRDSAFSITPFSLRLQA